MSAALESITKRRENSRWLGDHYSELAKKYRDEWVAVYDRTVIAHGKDLRGISRELRKKYKEGYGEIAFEFVTTKPIELIL